ncbi:MAG: DUF1501 domain-containing protein [Planctomycetaceae bacterium]|nr:DUF1501 domain-containing protein [Planctomycetaceae bacterium]
MTANRIGRRGFLRQAGTLAAFGLTVPSFLQQSRAILNAAPIAGLPDDRVLVLIQLAGGNDGLNTLVPYADDLYHRSRPKLAIKSEDVLRIDDYSGLHPEMYALKDLWDQGELAIVQNVGYPNPDRSHFRSTEIWETASGSQQSLATGWIGRYFDNACEGCPSPLLGIQFGERTAQTFAGEKPRCVTMSNPELFGFGGDQALSSLARIHASQPTGNSAFDFLSRTGNDVLAASRSISDAVKSQQTTATYLPFHFSQTLRVVAQMIAAEVPTRVYYVSLTGFDHHATQLKSHATLLQDLSEGLATFVADLKGMGLLDRTLVMTFSEFGRRLAENQSEGTDHGTANLMFLSGGAVKPGFHGERPSLANLDQVGDLVHSIDFRSVYASVLSSWLRVDHRQIMAPEIRPLAGLFG